MITNEEYEKYITTLMMVCDYYGICCAIDHTHDDVTIEFYGTGIPIYHENSPSTRGTIECFKNPSFRFNLRHSGPFIENIIHSTKIFFDDYLKIKATEETNKMWEELIMKNFTKKDLKNGDVVTTRDGDIGVVVLDRDLIFFRSGDYMTVKELGDDLTNGYNKDADVMVVNRDAVSFKKADPRHPFYDKCNIVYDRSKVETEEMTLEEVCKALGKNIKIVQRRVTYGRK